MIRPENVMTLGDSWASAVEADTGLQYGGWPEMLGLNDNHRAAVPGSTVHDWFTNKSGWLDKALDVISGGKIQLVLVSLLGNDCRQMELDKFNERRFIMDTATAMPQLGQIVTLLSHMGPHVICMQYANPYVGNPQAETIVGLMNTAIEHCSKAYFSIPDAIKGAEDMAFDGKDFHLTRAGHEMVAIAMRKVLELIPAPGEDQNTVGGVAVV